MADPFGSLSDDASLEPALGEELGSGAFGSPRSSAGFGPDKEGDGCEPRAVVLARQEAALVEYRLKYESSVAWLSGLAPSDQAYDEAACLVGQMRAEVDCLEQSLARSRCQSGSDGGPRPEHRPQSSPAVVPVKSVQARGQRGKGRGQSTKSSGFARHR